MSPPRNHTSSAQQTAQQGHLSTTRIRRMVHPSENSTLLMSYILHTQDSIGNSLQHNGTITSVEGIPKTLTSIWGNICSIWPHRISPEPSPIHYHPATLIKTKRVTKATSGYLQHGFAKITINPPAQLLRVKKTPEPPQRRGITQQPATEVPPEPVPCQRVIMKSKITMTPGRTKRQPPQTKTHFIPDDTDVSDK